MKFELLRYGDEGNPHQKARLTEDVGALKNGYQSLKPQQADSDNRL